MRLISILNLAGIGAAISPSAFYERVEVCKTRAQTLRLQAGFVRQCMDQARRKGLTISADAEKDSRTDSVCRYRAMSDLFSGEHRIPGTVCEDSFPSSGIPADCKYVIVTEREDDSDDDVPFTRVDGQFVAQALSRLVAVHELGFVAGIVVEFQRVNGIAILRLDPLSVKSMYLPSGELDERSMRLVKSDLEAFYKAFSRRFNNEALIRDFGTWARRIRIDRSDMLASSEYTDWMNRFADSNTKKVKTIITEPVRRSMMTSPVLSEFLPLLSHCNQELERARSDVEFSIGDEFTLTASDETLRVIARISGGGGGNIFSTNIPGMLIKRSFSRSDFCHEVSVLTVLKGLQGRVPDIYEIENPVGRMMVMQEVGESHWPGSGDPQRPSNEHLAQIIEIMRDLHDAGFAHHDIVDRNIRIDEQRVYLIDFGGVKPIYIGGTDLEQARRQDMLALADLIITPSAPGGLEMAADMHALLNDERPDYEKWIAHFRSLP